MTRTYLAVTAAFVFLVLGFSAAADAKTWQVTIAPRAEDAFEKAIYRLWLPPGVKQVRGVIFRQHGCGPGARQLGLEHADDIQWQALARKWDCALMGSQMWAPEEDCTTWTIPQDGSAHAFLTALSQLAELTGHGEIEHAPWCLWGHSGGAVWVTNMTYRYPERIVATFARSGGLSPIGREYTRSRPAEPDGNPAALAVPIMFCHGDRENVEGCRFYQGCRGAYAVYEYGRKHDAVWAMAVHPNSEHENSNSRLLAVRFFDAALAQRLPNETQSSGRPALRPVQREKAWLGDPGTHEIHPSERFSGDRQTMVWLPDQATAEAWRQWSRTGNITDQTPPPAPTDVALTIEGDAVVVTWKAEADVESGIRRFTIYRDGREIGEVRGPIDKTWNPAGNYHAWNYSDQPLNGTELPAMRFEDRDADRAATAKYQVATENSSGLQSSLSHPVVGP